MRGAAFARGQRVVGVIDPDALLSRQVSRRAIDPVALELLLLVIRAVVRHRASPSAKEIPNVSTRPRRGQTAASRPDHCLADAP
jgi:hypothetical protein